MRNGGIKILLKFGDINFESVGMVVKVLFIERVRNLCIRFFIKEGWLCGDVLLLEKCINLCWLRVYIGVIKELMVGVEKLWCGIGCVG